MPTNLKIQTVYPEHDTKDYVFLDVFIDGTRINRVEVEEEKAGGEKDRLIEVYTPMVAALEQLEHCSEEEFPQVGISYREIRNTLRQQNLLPLLPSSL